MPKARAFDSMGEYNHLYIAMKVYEHKTRMIKPSISI